MCDEENCPECEEEASDNPITGWRDAFNEAYYQAQVEAMKTLIKKKWGKTIDSVAETTLDYFIAELVSSEKHAEAEEKVKAEIVKILSKAKK